MLSAPRKATTEDQIGLTLGSATEEILSAVGGRCYWEKGGHTARIDFRPLIGMDALAAKLVRVNLSQISTFGGARIHLAVVNARGRYYPISLAASEPQIAVAAALAALNAGISQYAGPDDDYDEPSEAPRYRRKKRAKRRARKARRR